MQICTLGWIKIINISQFPFRLDIGMSMLIYCTQQLYSYYMKSQNKKKVVGQYEIYMDICLGGGAFGYVYEGINKKTKQIVAVKMIERSKLGHGSIRQQYMINALKRQTIILSRISSENVVGFRDILSTKRYYYIIQQKCDCDLRSYLLNQKQKRVSEKQAIQYMTQILNGFYALIVTNVIHRDIKPENFLMKNGKVKIADFGLSRRVNGQQMMVSAVGTKGYSSPQIIRHERYTSKCDIWSLGCVFYEMLYGRMLFGVPINKLYSQMKQIQQYGIDFPDEPQVSQQTKDLIKACLRLKQQDRADWIYLFNHRYFVQNLPSLKKLNMSLNYIISTIRRQIDQKNIDLQKFFSKLGIEKKHELKLDTYTKLILQLVPANKVTVEQIKFSFNYFDADRSGKVSFEQFAKTLQRFGVEMNASSRDKIISNIILTVQTNEQGKQNDQNLSPEEILVYKKKQAAYQKLLGLIINKNIQNVEEEFKLVDLRQEGIDSKQFKHLVQVKFNCPQMNQEECELVFDKFDQNKDKTLSFQEFYKYFCKMLKLPQLISFIKPESNSSI